MQSFKRIILCKSTRIRGLLQRTSKTPYRAYSTAEPYGEFYFKNLTIELTKNPKTKIKEPRRFGWDFTDHMLEVEWTRDQGWKSPRIVPYHNLSLDPACTVFHYAVSCFEGMKAYSSTTGKKEKYLFRPYSNAKRLNTSTQRLALPTVKEEEFVKCLAALVDIERDWIPTKRGYSLYLRPTVIATEEHLGVSHANKALLYVICSPCGPYFSKGFNPVKLLADPNYVRAVPGGTGFAKIAANYAPTIMPQKLASEKGYDQMLWLIGPNHQISEVGSMNLMIYWKNKNGEPELITPPLDGTILPGVTRDSILNIAKEWGITTKEIAPTMKELIDALKEKRIIEIFGAGTAAIVCPVKAISYNDVEYDIPVPDKGLAYKLVEYILSIQHGEIDHPYCISVEKILGK